MPNLDDDDVWMLSALRRDREEKLPALKDNPVLHTAFTHELWLLDFIEKIQPGSTTDTRTLDEFMADLKAKLRRY